MPRTVVITGASSGLGRALALELADRRDTLVLAARRGDVLEEVARDCRARGAVATAATTDVTDEVQVRQLAETAVARHGHIDAWINNAGVTLYSRLEDGPFEDHRRVIETNLFGAMFGARAVVPIFRRQHRGVLINVGSVLSAVGQAFVPTYVISKFGVRGLSEALRVELADEPDIHVCTVLPYAIDTPHFQVAANHVGRAPRALPPTQTPEHVAREIARLIDRPRRVRHVPRSIALGLVWHALMPRLTEQLLLAALRRWHFDDRADYRATGNLYDPPAVPTGVTGDRPPRLGTAALGAWLAGQLVKLEASRVRSWFTRRRAA